MLFYDFEVFKYDWLAVVIDSDTQKESVIINDRDQLEALYEANKYNIWVGFNSRHYDQYILKGILCDFDPKEINDFIIVQRMDGWQFSRELNKIPLNNYDVMPNPPIGLKTLEGFLGSDIRETEVPFDLDRKLTQEELDQTVFYCRHDVEETIKVFLEKIDDFHAMYGIVKAFTLPLSCIGDTEARITSKVLGCVKKSFHDEFDYFFLPCIQLNKYAYVMEWFRNAVPAALDEMCERGFDTGTDSWEFHQHFYKRSLETIVAGIPHVFGFGGLHGAPDKPVHKKGLILHVDVGSYYPSMLIGWGLVTRAATNDNYKRVYDTRMSLKAAGKKKEQAPYKKLLNALSGAMKDVTNPAYDPRNNNCMCINGQLMLLDLIEHLEAVPGFELIQSNTDGLIIQIQRALYREQSIFFFRESGHGITDNRCFQNMVQGKGNRLPAAYLWKREADAVLVYKTPRRHAEPGAVPFRNVCRNVHDRQRQTERDEPVGIIRYGTSGRRAGQGAVKRPDYQRTDEYGGSLENRCRLDIEVLKAVREAVGPFFPIEFRMSGFELVPEGYGLKEGVEIAKMIEPYVDIIHVSAGTYQKSFGDTHPSMFKEHGCNVYLAAEIKKHVSKPAATIGGLNDPAQLEEIIALGKADIVYMARALLADPELPRKVVENRVRKS